MITEFLYRGPSVMHDNLIEWTLKENGTALSEGVPNRLVLTLVNQEDGASVVIDSSVSPYNLGVPGSNETFRYTEATGRLTIDLGGVAVATLPVGTYTATLDWYDVINANGVRWGADRIAVVVKE